MKNIFFNILVVFCLLVATSCKTNKNIISTDGNEREIDEVEVIKFMGTVYDYPRGVDEKIFWDFKEEHAKLFIGNSGFIQDVKNLRSNKSDRFREYNYAFIVKKGKEIDTLYSDNTLQTWLLKKNKKQIYFYDEEGKIAENLIHIYSFFKDCW
jgi:hypothetical protein